MNDVVVTITELGHRGDGIAKTPDGPFFVPYGLPGETVVVHKQGNRGELEEIVTPSPDRKLPICAHFGECGGCMVQHFAHEPYLAWKRETVVAALKDRGLDIPVRLPVGSVAGTRRRAVFNARRITGGMVFGFNARKTNVTVPITACPVLHPAIVKALPQLRELAVKLLQGREILRFTVLHTTTGLDVAVNSDNKKTIDAAYQAAAGNLGAGIVRLSVNGEVVAEAVRPLLEFGKTKVTPPPGGFVQATAEGEAELAEAVCGPLAGAEKVVDLFAGCGTFSMRLAENSKVHAVETEAASVDALLQGSRQASGLRPITAERRDLFRRPLSALELADYDGVVFDPPRAGAAAQVAEIAASKVPVVVAISCSPSTFARDIKTLIDGGYVVDEVITVDQFIWSPHIELVAVFRRP